MFKFIKNFQKGRQIKQQIVKLKLKAELAKYKTNAHRAKSKEKLGKYSAVLGDYRAMGELADQIMEDYDDGGADKLLENPLVKQLIASFIKRSSGNTGLETSEREKQLKNVLDALPQDVLDKIQKKLK